ncbi:MAG: chromate resistance protein ChrB domain-containing protein [Chthoniobacterales bacterium]
MLHHHHMDQIPWLLLLYSLPAHRNTQRVAVWRRFKKIGALQLTTSTYLLPDQPGHYEHFQWLTKLIHDSGGEATLVRVREIEGMPNEKLVGLFNEARDREYAAVSKVLHSLRRERKPRADIGDELIRVTRQFRDLRAIDFFNSQRGQEIEMQLQKLERNRAARGEMVRIDPADYRGRTWVTRPRPEIDRVGSAWLVRKFIDLKARFAFAGKIPPRSDAVSFDMLDAVFSHVGDDCTFETLTKRFAIRDKAVRKIAEMIHDADVEDEKFQRPEGIGIDRVLKGWGKEGLPDDEILRRGFECFDALYAFLQRR